MEMNGADLLASLGFDAEVAAQNRSQGAGGSNDVNLVNSGPLVPETDDVNAIGSVSQWPRCVPQHVYAQLQKLTDMKEVGTNRKGFYSSYPNLWAKLDSQQRNKSINFFLALPSERKIQILKNAEDLTKSQTKDGTVADTWILPYP